MEYWRHMSNVASANLAEIEADLDLLRQERRKVQQHLEDLDRRIAAYELLVQLGEQTDRGEGAQRTMTLHEAMAQVLRSTNGRKLRAPDLALEINKKGLYRMRDGRPVEAQQIHARVGNYGHMFERVGTFIGLVEDADGDGLPS